MDSVNLVRMANRIGEFFEAMPERDEALQGIAEHIRKFWEPRMRAELARVLASPDEAQALKPIVREALVLHPLTLPSAAQAYPNCFFLAISRASSTKPAAAGDRRSMLHTARPVTRRWRGERLR